MEIGLEIAKLRYENKLTQKELAKKLSVSVSLIGLWETNKRLPSLDNFIAIIDYFHIDADALLLKDRKNAPLKKQDEYEDDPGYEKLRSTFMLLNQDNKDILIGESKKLLKEQRLEEKEEKRKSLVRKNEAG